MAWKFRNLVAGWSTPDVSNAVTPRKMDTPIQTAAAVVKKAGRDKPADTVLREMLRARKGTTRPEGRAVSEAVFAYYRWLRWLNPKDSVSHQIGEAVQRGRDFWNKPNAVSDDELAQAVPNWVKDFMDVSPEWLRALQTEPKLWLRARVGKGGALADKLGDCQQAGPGALEDTLLYNGENDLFRTPEFHAGEFELQDISSQVVGLVCQPQPGETWWDACAGEGGKLMHLGDLMRNKGLIWASDRAAWRLQLLKRRAARAKVFNYRAALWDGGPKLPTKGKFDGILVDAPCSGLGTWQRNPHGRWTMQPEDVRELAEVQKQLVSRAVGSLKPNGKLIYSVCTLTRAETVEVAEFITGKFPELKPLPLENPLQHGGTVTNQIWLWPQTVDGNGMFIAGWRRKSVGG